MTDILFQYLFADQAFHYQLGKAREVPIAGRKEQCHASRYALCVVCYGMP